MPLGEGNEKAVVEPPRAQRGVSIDAHAAPHGGWRRLWAVARVALLLAAATVLGINLVRCGSVHEAKGAHPTAPNHADHGPAKAE